MGKMLNITIDCAPGGRRPDLYIKDALNCLGIVTENIPDTVNRFFGAWTWNIPCEVSEEEYNNNSDKLQEYFENLYNRGRIRYADFSLE